MVSPTTALPAWAPAVPFAALLVALVLAPVLVPHWWHKPLWRLLGLLLLAAPAAIADAVVAPVRIGHAVDEYASFLLLLWALYQLASGIVLTGPFSGTPRANVALLAVGATLASFIGTTGASMLLLPPLLRANQGRALVGHLILFFIYLVGNVGGLLLPLGDPPLFLGFLHGVPFFWTVRLWPFWLLNSVLLLALAWVFDARAYGREAPAVRVAAAERAQTPWHIEGAHHFIGFAAVTLLLGMGPAWGLGPHQQQGMLLLVAATSLLLTPAHVRAFNQFRWEPLIEVAVLFLPLFLAMPQALSVVVAYQEALPLRSPEAFYWWTGALSSVLDNAPCYMTFATLANAQNGFAGTNLAPLTESARGAPSLMAIAHGAVSMGAMTYIGNGPNLLVRQRAQEAGWRTPGFFAYVGWALLLLLPTLWLTRWVVASGDLV